MDAGDPTLQAVHGESPFSVVAGCYATCIIDGVLDHSPAEHVRRPNVPAESHTLGLTPLQFEAMLTAARESSNVNDFALVAMLGLLGLRIFEACNAGIADLAEEHGHRVLRVTGKGGKFVLMPLPPAVGRAIDRAVAGREGGPILRTRRGTRRDRHAATRRLHRLADAAGVRLPRMHPHMLRHTFVTTMLDAGVDLRDVQIAARHADPRTTMRYDRARKNLDRHPNYILAATWPPAPDRQTRSADERCAGSGARAVAVAVVLAGSLVVCRRFGCRRGRVGIRTLSQAVIVFVVVGGSDGLCDTGRVVGVGTGLVMARKRTRRVGILTAGGDSPGLNAAIRGFGKTAIGHYGMELLGFRDG